MMLRFTHQGSAETWAVMPHPTNVRTTLRSVAPSAGGHDRPSANADQRHRFNKLETSRRDQRGRVGEAAGRLVELRDGWLNPPGLDPADLEKRTLTNLYNQRPTWLDNAHATVDAAVFDAYGWPADRADAEILDRLLALNLDRAIGASQ